MRKPLKKSMHKTNNLVCQIAIRNEKMTEPKAVKKELQQLVATLASSSEPIKKGIEKKSYFCYYWSRDWVGCSDHTIAT